MVSVNSCAAANCGPAKGRQHHAKGPSRPTHDKPATVSCPPPLPPPSAPTPVLESVPTPCPPADAILATSPMQKRRHHHVTPRPPPPPTGVAHLHHLRLRGCRPAPRSATHATHHGPLHCHCHHPMCAPPTEPESAPRQAPQAATEGPCLPLPPLPRESSSLRKHHRVAVQRR
jgi:hypothetical protein